jgi:hypothetical protein
MTVHRVNILVVIGVCWIIVSGLVRSAIVAVGREMRDLISVFSAL